MGQRLPGRRPCAVVIELGEEASGWTSPPVLVARSFRHRLLGLRPAPFGWALLLPGRGVHGRGVATSLSIVSITSDGCSGKALQLAPGRRLVAPPGVAAVLELPADWPLPPPGATLLARPIVMG